MTCEICGTNHRDPQDHPYTTKPPAPGQREPDAGIIRMAEHIAGAWKKYKEFFQQPPHGTTKQIAAMIELCPQLKEAIRLFEKQREEGMTR